MEKGYNIKGTGIDYSGMFEDHQHYKAHVIKIISVVFFLLIIHNLVSKQLLEKYENTRLVCLENIMWKRDVLLYMEHRWNRYVLCFEQWKIKKDDYNNEKQV